MRSLLLFFLGIPIPIIILIALFVHQARHHVRKRMTEHSGGVDERRHRRTFE